MHQSPQRIGCAPGFSGAVLVAHAVTVRTQTGKVIEPRAPSPRRVEGGDVVHFDVSLAQRPVGLREVEVADFTPQGSAALPSLLDLQAAKFRVTLAGESPPDEQSALHRGDACVIVFIRLRRDELQLARGDALFDRVGGVEHLLLAVDEGPDHQSCGLTAPGAPTGVARVVRGEIRGLAADAVGRPEAGEGVSLCGVEGERKQQLGQFLHPRVSGPQFAPAVAHHECAREYEFILSPRRSPHAQYRMSVRRGGGCVQRTGSRAAHLGRSRCQWGLSPSVMVVRAECPPLRIGKEGA